MATHHQAQHQAADALADLGRDVVAELLQCREEALELAELPGAARWWQLLIGQRGGGVRRKQACIHKHSPATSRRQLSPSL